MSPLLPITLAYVVGILLCELPAMAALAVLGMLSVGALLWWLLRLRFWGWSILIAPLWLGYFMMQLAAPAQPMHSDEARSIEASCRQRLYAADLDSLTVSLAEGILFGDKRAVDPQLKTAMREAGMSHILAVSGLHVGILFAIFLSLLWPLRFFGRDGLRQLLVLLILWLYIALIGFPASAMRAALMITVAVLSWFHHSNPWGWHNLTVAAFVLLLWRPYWLWDLGFQLSFLATAGILAFQPLIQSPHAGFVSQAWHYLKSPFWLSAAAQIATLPLVANVFGHVPLLGMLQGFVVVPLLPFYVGGLLLVMVFPALGTWLSPLLCGFTAWIQSIADVTIQSEYALLGGRLEWSPSRLEMWIAYLGILAAVLLFVPKKSH